MLTRFTTLPTLWRDVDDLFRDFAQPEEPRALAPAADIVETEKAFEIHLDLPGVKPEEIDIKLDDSTLVVTAERKPAEPADLKGWLRRERAYGRYVRTFTLPRTVTAPEATYTNGVLVLTLPKREEALPRTVKVRAN